MSNLRLTVDFIPISSPYKSVYENVSKGTWDLIRKKTYKQNDYRCQICWNKGFRWPVECHEDWEFDDDTNTQILKGMISVCPLCHKVKHMAESKGKYWSCLHRLAHMNRMTREEAKQYFLKEKEIWERRSQQRWYLDIFVLRDYIRTETK